MVFQKQHLQATIYVCLTENSVLFEKYPSNDKKKPTMNFFSK